MKMTATTSADPSAKFAMYFMNAFFILLFNTFPSGLNLYYTMYNVLNFIQQKQLKQLEA
jgi:YidC/Oxa1 family membrane protein insertase